MAKQTKTASIELTDGLNAKVVDGYLITSCPYDAKGRPSSSGKSMINASSGGNVPMSLNDKVHKIGLNCYTAV